VVSDATTDARTRHNSLVTGEMRVRFYAGAPLRTSEGFGLGTLCILDRQPRDLSASDRRLLEKLALLAMEQLEVHRTVINLAELREAHQRSTEELRQANQALAQSEQRFRDLFDEAPIAYVHEDLDTRFLRANRAAMRTLGVKPEEVEGTYGRNLVPNTPAAQQRVQEALAAIGRGADTSGVVLELRRKDDGRPVWIQWWSRPDPGGSFTRTMFIDITDRILMEQEQRHLQAQNAYLQEEIRTEQHFGEIVGNSPALLQVMQQIDQVAPTDSTVLLTGETGTGKELFARAIHERGARKGRPLVKVNCAAISSGLVESELFGHVKGAFTGALVNRDGRFKVADGGTLFLDEVGELPLETQVKLLRVLQEHEFEPAGSSKSIRVDVRVIAASNRDLQGAVAAGRFRADLFYRLNVFPIQFETEAPTFVGSSIFSSPASRSDSARRLTSSPKKPWSAWSTIRGRETSASFKTSSSGPLCSQKARSSSCMTRWRCGALNLPSPARTNCLPWKRSSGFTSSRFSSRPSGSSKALEGRRRSSSSTRTRFAAAWPSSASSEARDNPKFGV